jgi:hypothetical protein
MQRYQDSVLTQNANGVTVVGTGLTVTVYNAGTVVLATIYSDNGVTSVDQLTTPIITDINGRFEFYATNGRYDITITGEAITTITVQDIYLEDLSQFFGGNYADNTGTVNALAASYPTVVTNTLADGYPLEIDTSILGTNTGTVTMTPILLGTTIVTRPVLKFNGVRSLVNLVAGDVPTVAQLRYNMDALAWVLINPVAGEVIASPDVHGTIALVTNTLATVASIVLSVGDWDVTGVVMFALAATTYASHSLAGSNSATTMGAICTYADSTENQTAPTYGSVITKVIPARCYKVTVPTTVYLLANLTFTTSTAAAVGIITARRAAQ